jgi:hypothetical protein
MRPSLGLIQTEIPLRHLELIHEAAPWTSHLRVQRCEGLTKALFHEGVKIAVDKRAAAFAAATDAEFPQLEPWRNALNFVARNILER